MINEDQSFANEQQKKEHTHVHYYITSMCLRFFLSAHFCASKINDWIEIESGMVNLIVRDWEEEWVQVCACACVCVCTECTEFEMNDCRME